MEQLIADTLRKLAKGPQADHSRSSFSFSDGSFQFTSLPTAKKTSATHPIVEIKLTKLQECGKYYTAPDNVTTEKMFSDLFNDSWKTDHFHFTPCGFSLNALQPEYGESYATIHVTPEQDFSYVSFETNCMNELKSQMKDLLYLFCPREVIITGQFQNDEADSLGCDGKHGTLHDLINQACGFEFELKSFEEHIDNNVKIVSYRYNFPLLEW